MPTDKAYYFDGVNDYLLVNQQTSDYSKGATVCMWAKFNSFGGVFSQQTGSEFNIYCPSGVNSRIQLTAGQTLTSTGSISTGSWYHVSAIYNPAGSPNTAQIYINSVLDSQGYINLVSPNANNIVIGSIMNGYIDDFRIYNKVLAPDDIALIYNYGSGTDANLYGKKVMNGLLDKNTLTGQATSDKISLIGKDHTGVLQDITIQPEVYTNQEIGNIIIDFMIKYCPEITYNNVQFTGIVLPRLTFSHDTIFQALKKLGSYCGFIFYVDENKDLHFEPASNIDSGYTLDTTNTKQANFATARTEIANSVWVYGDKVLSGWQQSFAATGGSVYTLAYSPHNTRVEVNGTIYRGGVDEFASTAESGTQYLINYNDKNVILVSGTGLGNWIPGSNIGSVYVRYDRSLPIVKYSIDRDSINTYGQKDKVIIDKSIKDSQEAEDLMRNTLDTLSNPKTEGTVNLIGCYSGLDAGMFVNCNYPNEGIGNKQYNVLSVSYDLTPQKNLSNDVVSVKLNQRIKNLTDEIVDIKEQLLKIQAGDVVSSDFISRFESWTGSIGISANYNLYTKSLGGGFIMGDIAHSRIGYQSLGSGVAVASWNLFASGGAF